jgi:hypothetical protein
MTRKDIQQHIAKVKTKYDSYPTRPIMDNEKNVLLSRRQIGQHWYQKRRAQQKSRKEKRLRGKKTTRLHESRGLSQTRAHHILERISRTLRVRDSGKARDVTLYENPTRHELLRLAGGYRGDVPFLADSRLRKVYAWSAEEDPRRVHKELRYYTKDPRVLSGTIAHQRGQWIMVGSDTFDQYPHLIDSVAEKDWQWVDTFFDVSSYLDAITQEHTARAVEPHVVSKKLLWGL